MEFLLVLLITTGLVIALVLMMNSNSLRDPTKADITLISSIDAEKLARYPDVCLLSKNFSLSTFSISNKESMKKVKVYSIYLLSRNHRIKIKIAGFKSKKAAINSLKFISEKHSKNIVKYNPTISAQSKGRR